MKKRILLSMGVVMVLSSCGNNTESSKESTDNENTETVTLNIVDQTSGLVGEQGGWFGEYLLNELNVKVNIEDNTLVSDDHATMADYDLIILGDKDTYKEAIKEGYVLSLEDDELLAKYGAYISDNMQDNISYNLSLSEDGKLYGIGGNYSKDDDAGIFDRVWNIRWDLYKEAGYPSVSNMDEYIEALKEVKEAAGNDKNGEEVFAYASIPEWDGELPWIASNMVSAYYGYDQFGKGFYNPEDGTYTGALGNSKEESESSYLDMIRYLNKMNQEGLLMPYSEDTTYDSYSEKLLNDGIVAAINSFDSDIYNTEENISDGKVFESLIPTDARPFSYQYGNSYKNGSGACKYYVIGANSKNPEKAMELIDFLAKPETNLTAMYGPKGVVWDYDEDGDTVFTEFGGNVYLNSTNEEMPEPYSGNYDDGKAMFAANIWDNYAINHDSNGERFYYEDWHKYNEDQKGDIEKDWETITGMHNADEYMRNTNYVVSPVSEYDYLTNFEEVTNSVDSWSKVSEIIIEKSYEAIYADSDDACEEAITQMIEEAYENGYEDCNNASIEQAALRSEAESK